MELSADVASTVLARIDLSDAPTANEMRYTLDEITSDFCPHLSGPTAGV